MASYNECESSLKKNPIALKILAPIIATEICVHLIYDQILAVAN